MKHKVGLGLGLVIVTMCVSFLFFWLVQTHNAEVDGLEKVYETNLAEVKAAYDEEVKDLELRLEKSENIWTSIGLFGTDRGFLDGYSQVNFECSDLKQDGALVLQDQANGLQHFDMGRYKQLLTVCQNEDGWVVMAVDEDEKPLLLKGYHIGDEFEVNELKLASIGRWGNELEFSLHEWWIYEDSSVSRLIFSLKESSNGYSIDVSPVIYQYKEITYRWDAQAEDVLVLEHCDSWSNSLSGLSSLNCNHMEKTSSPIYP